jgi:hypothetical protein
MTKYKQFGDCPSITVIVTEKDMMDSKNEVQINWSTCGALPVKQARDFYNQMDEALEFARHESLRLAA